MPDVFRARARTFWFAARFLPADRRHAVAGLYAFARAVDDLVDEPPPTLNPDDVRAELAAWRGWLEHPTHWQRRNRSWPRASYPRCWRTACRPRICRCWSMALRPTSPEPR